MKIQTLLSFLIAGAMATAAQAASHEKGDHEHAAEKSGEKPEMSATDEQLNKFIDKATDIFEKNQANPKKRIPDGLLGEAKAVMILRVTRGGFILGASSGAGIAFKNNIENWSPPAFYSVASGSLGLQIGGAESHIIALFMTDKAYDLLDDPTMQWGVGADVVAGPVGGRANLNTVKGKDILLYDTTKGLEVGVSVAGGKLSPNKKFNAELYDKEDITVEWILGSRVPMPAAAKDLADLLKSYSFDEGAKAANVKVEVKAKEKE